MERAQTQVDLKKSMLGLVEPLDRQSMIEPLQNALATIPAEQLKPSALDKVRTRSGSLHKVLSQSGLNGYLLAEQRALQCQAGIEALLMLNELAFEHEQLRRKHDALIAEFLMVHLRTPESSLRPDSLVDGSYGNLRIMCNAINLDFNKVTTGAVPKWEQLQALQEARAAGVVSDKQFETYSDWIQKYTGS